MLQAISDLALASPRIRASISAREAEARPYALGFAALWVPQTKILGGNLGLSLGSADNFAWAHGVLTGLINAEETVQGWGFGDTTARAQLGWTSGALSNTLYLTTGSPPGVTNAVSIRTPVRITTV